MGFSYVAVSKPSLDMQSWIQFRKAWRAGSLARFGEQAHALGMDCLEIGANTSGYYEARDACDASIPEALLRALSEVRADLALLIRAPELEAGFVQDPEHPWTANTRCYFLFPRDGLVGLLTVLEFDDDTRGRDPRDVRAWAEPIILHSGAKAARTAARILNGVFGVEKAKWSIDGAYTHFIALSVGVDIDTTAVRETHRGEEFDDADLTQTLQLTDLSLSYARPGWGHSSFCGERLGLVALAAPPVIHADLAYGMLWERTRELLDKPEITETPTLDQTIEQLQLLEALQFELRVWVAEQERYLRSLKPWQLGIFKRLQTYWSVDVMEERLHEFVSFAVQQAKSRIDVHQARSDRSQARILGAIASLEIIGVFSSVAGYLYFVERVPSLSLDGLFSSPGFSLLVFLSPIVVAFAVLALLLFLFRR